MTLAFKQLHQEGTFAVINVHDPGTAVLAQDAGAVAIGTSSSAHAYSIAVPDARGALSKQRALRRAAEICAAVSIPVTIDAENGWGHTPDEVAESIEAIGAVGAAGACIEDWSGDQFIGIYERSLARDRIEAAVGAARALPQPFVLCARSETFLYETPDPLREAITRLQSYAEAGADCLYAPGPTDRSTLGTLVRESGGPLNALIGVGTQNFTMDDARELGIRRVSIGGSLQRACLATFTNAVKGIVDDGTFHSDVAPIPSDQLERLFSQTPPRT